VVVFIHAVFYKAFEINSQVGYLIQEILPGVSVSHPRKPALIAAITHLDRNANYLSETLKSTRIGSNGFNADIGPRMTGTFPMSAKRYGHVTGREPVTVRTPSIDLLLHDDCRGGYAIHSTYHRGWDHYGGIAEVHGCLLRV